MDGTVMTNERNIGHAMSTLQAGCLTVGRLARYAAHAMPSQDSDFIELTIVLRYCASHLMRTQNEFLYFVFVGRGATDVERCAGR